MKYEFGDHISIEHEIGLDWKLSKNSKMTFRDGKAIFNANKHELDRIAQDLGYLSMSKGIQWKKQKTWVIIIAHKPNHRGDVANFVDGISDAVKKAIQLDDCWYSFILDYEIDEEAKIVIKVIQEG